MFGGIGSVATSAVPVFENINSTSGNFEMAVSTLRCIANDCSRLTEGTRVEASAIFFSSSCGMNSEPRSPKEGNANRKKTKKHAIKAPGLELALRSKERSVG